MFDLDGVLADSARLHFVAWKAIADELGIGFTEADNEALKGVDRMGSLAAILALDGRNLNAAAMHELTERKNAAYVAAVAEMTPADLLPGAIELLDGCAAAGLTLTLASASRNAPAVIDHLGIAARFACVADPATCRPKPAPDLFLACAAATGIDPARAVGFEDATAGIAAIRAAGMRAVGIGVEGDVTFATTGDVDLSKAL